MKFTKVIQRILIYYGKAYNIINFNYKKRG